MLWTDARDKWFADDMPDPRVRHYWDEDKVVGQWLAQNIEGDEGVVWDRYYLFGPEALWADLPTSLLGSGGTIIAEREALQQQILPFLR